MIIIRCWCLFVRVASRQQGRPCWSVFAFRSLVQAHRWVHSDYYASQLAAGGQCGGHFVAVVVASFLHSGLGLGRRLQVGLQQALLESDQPLEMPLAHPLRYLLLFAQLVGHALLEEPNLFLDEHTVPLALL
jgi:hypothetical protein